MVRAMRRSPTSLARSTLAFPPLATTLLTATSTTLGSRCAVQAVMAAADTLRACLEPECMRGFSNRAGARDDACMSNARRHWKQTLLHNQLLQLRAVGPPSLTQPPRRRCVTPPAAKLDSTLSWGATSQSSATWSASGEQQKQSVCTGVGAGVGAGDGSNEESGARGAGRWVSAKVFCPARSKQSKQLQDPATQGL